MEESLHLYETLMRLPLFSGLGSEEISQIIAQTKFQFLRLDAGKFLCHQDEKCTLLVVLIHGAMNVVTHSDDHGCIVTESLSAPCLVAPSSLFGLHQRYLHSYQCVETCRFVLLNKDEVFRMFDRYFIFKINWLNLLSTQVQKKELQLWHTPPANLRQRILRFFLIHTEKPAGKKTFRIKMTRLAEEVNDSRLNVSIQLNAMEDEGLITLQRGIITIPALEKLLQSR